jgi:glycosyltransferase involved in cell wall biosynthesis
MAVIPRVTVVTPTLNAARFFDDCLASLDAQRKSVEVEHIVVDDGSTDDTREIAVAAGANVLEGERAGLYAAMNLGLASASGDYVGVLNADDYLYPGALTSLVAAIDRSGRPWAIGNLTWVDGQRHPRGTLAPPPPWLPPAALACLGWNWLHHQTTYMTRTFWSSLGGFDTSFRSAADYDLLLRARRASPFATVHTTIAAFRRHGENVSMVLDVAGHEEARIQDMYGPSSPAAAQLIKLFDKALVNARNPRWALTKRWVKRARSPGDG